jgi:hypothetical protein
VYFKIPQRVVTEYQGVVYSKDFLGRVHRHSKNNLKKANERSVSLFGSLPEDIKIALGGEFTENTWNEIKNNKLVHDYLHDTEIQQEPQIVTRQRLAMDTHALERGGQGNMTRRLPWTIPPLLTIWRKRSYLSI